MWAFEHINLSMIWWCSEPCNTHNVHKPSQTYDLQNNGTTHSVAFVSRNQKAITRITCSYRNGQLGELVSTSTDTALVDSGTITFQRKSTFHNGHLLTSGLDKIWLNFLLEAVLVNRQSNSNAVNNMGFPEARCLFDEVISLATSVSLSI